MDKPRSVGSKCKDCYNENVTTNKERFSQEQSQKGAESANIEMYFPGGKPDALRWVMEAPLDALPSVQAP